MYRPLSNNEYAIVSKTIYEERGLSGGLADSMFMAYKARAMALDEPEFVIFQESEVERKTRLVEKQNEKVVELQTGAELGPVEFLKKLDAIVTNDKPSKEPKNKYEWFFGDETKLDSRFKRLRVKFFNSQSYRRHILQRYIDDGFLSESHIHDLELVGRVLREFHHKYPGTRQGIISYYEILFGDPAGFSYEQVKEREAFHSDASARKDILQKLNIQADLSDKEIREYLRKSAIQTGALSAEQIDRWESTVDVELNGARNE